MNFKTTISLTKRSSVNIRRIYSLIAFLMNCACLALFLVGFIPFYGRNMNAINAVNCFFEIFDIAIQYFWYVAFCVLFSVFYVIIGVMMIRRAAISFIVIKGWLFSKLDNVDAREKSDYAVDSFNSSLLQLLMLYVFSNIVSSFYVDLASSLIITVLIIANAVVNALRYVYIKRNIAEALSVALGYAFVLYALFLYAFNISTLQIADFFHSFVVFFSLPLFDMSFSFILELIFTQFVAPVIHFCALLSMVNIYASINNKDSYKVSKAKNLLIRNMVYVGCALFMVGMANDYKNILNYFDLAKVHLDIIALTVMIYVGIKNTRESISDVGYFDPPPIADGLAGKLNLAPELLKKEAEQAQAAFVPEEQTAPTAEEPTAPVAEAQTAPIAEEKEETLSAEN